MFLSRQQLAERWGCCKETIKRRERAGILKPVRFSRRSLRYRIKDIEEIERQASGQ